MVAQQGSVRVANVAADTAPGPFKVRDAIREILGERCADGILTDCGEDWAVYATAVKIKRGGGAHTFTERRFLDWLDQAPAPAICAVS